MGCCRIGHADVARLLNLAVQISLCALDIQTQGDRVTAIRLRDISPSRLLFHYAAPSLR